MTNRLRKLVTWTLLTQVALVGGLGTGLHGLFGCEHGSGGACAAACCKASAAASSGSDCEDCVFCRHTAEKRATRLSDSADNLDVASAAAVGCDGCAVCDLLAQFRCATPFEFDPLAIELASGEASIQRENAAIAAAIRLALSRGPPAV